MKNLQNLKVYSLHFFYRQLDRKNRVLFWLLFISIVFLAGAVIWMGSNPFRLSISVSEVSDQTRQVLKISEATANYRTIDLDFPAYQEAVSFTASPILAPILLVNIFLIFQTLGWAFLLAASTRIRNWWCYPIYLVFSMYMYFSGYGAILAPESEMLANAAIIIPFLILAFLFQQEIVRVNLLVRSFLFLILLGALNSFIFFQEGWMGLHTLAVGGFPILAIVILFYLFFIGSDLTNLLIYSTTNFKDPQKRKGVGFISGLYALLFVVEFILFQKHADLQLFNLEIGLRPLHLLGIISILTVATQQNIYPAVREKFKGNAGFTILIASLVVVALSAIAFYISQGEILFLRLLERHMAIFLFLMGFFHFIYIMLNFSQLLTEKVNIYFLMRLPKRLLYFFIIATTVLVSIGLDAKDRSKSKKLVMATYHNLLGDHALYQGDEEEARLNYKAGIYYASGSVKGNYNLASLLIGEPGNYGQRISDLYAKAGRLIDFPYAALNRGNWVGAMGDRRMAKIIFREYLKENSTDPYISNNLGMMFRKEGIPDSAITYLRDGMMAGPDIASIYGNMGLVYMENNKSQNAAEFFNAGLQLKHPSATLITNSLFFSLKEGDSLKIEEDVFKNPEIENQEALLYNRALLLYHLGEIGKTQALLEKMMAVDQSSDVLFLDGVLKFDRGEVTEAISRMEYINGSDPDFKTTANHFMGIGFFRAGMPEMAAEYFRKAGEAGLENDHFLAALMEIDAGNHEYAQNQLNLIRVLYAHLWEPVAREMGMLLRAYGQGDLAYTEWDFEGMTFNEAMRIAIYSGQAQNNLNLLDNFLTATKMDTTSVLPYLELGRINLKNKDPLAMANLRAGLQVDPTSLPLQIEISRAWIQQGDIVRAQSISDSLMAIAPNTKSVRFLQAQVSVASGDSSQAVKELEALVTAYPLDIRILTTLGGVYRKQRESLLGYQKFFDATQLNERNSDIWYYLAVFAQQLGDMSIEDCGFSAIKAIEFSYDGKKKLQIAGEFSKEIKAISDY